MRSSEESPSSLELLSLLCWLNCSFAMELSVALPPNIACRLAIKTGEPFTAARDKVPPVDFVFRVGDGHLVFKATVQGLFETAASRPWSDDRGILVKPTNNAPQKSFVPLRLAEPGFIEQISTVWHKARLRQNGQASFQLEVFVYVAKIERGVSLRRATGTRIQEQLPRVAAFMEEQGVRSGPASQLYMATNQARLLESTPLRVPDNATFRQLQFIDAQEAEQRATMAADQAASTEEYMTIRVKICGAVVSMQVSIADVRSALDLPTYSLRPPFRQPVQFETPDPAFDMHDVDHDEPDNGDDDEGETA